MIVLTKEQILRLHGFRIISSGLMGRSDRPGQILRYNGPHIERCEMSTFREIHEDEVPQVLELIRARMAWMDEVGLHHWNDFAYDELFPLSYYEERCRNGELFDLANDAQEILCAAVLLSHDTRWPDDPPAIYVHALVSRIGAVGAGSEFLACIERYAAELGRQYCRLDVLVGSTTLERYYAERGYVAAGECTEGEYHGILRQKELQETCV